MWKSDKKHIFIIGYKKSKNYISTLHNVIASRTISNTIANPTRRHTLTITEHIEHTKTDAIIRLSLTLRITAAAAAAAAVTVGSSILL